MLVDPAEDEAGGEEDGEEQEAEGQAEGVADLDEGDDADDAGELVAGAPDAEELAGLVGRAEGPHDCAAGGADAAEADADEAGDGPERGGRRMEALGEGQAGGGDDPGDQEDGDGAGVSEPVLELRDKGEATPAVSATARAKRIVWPRELPSPSLEIRPRK